MCKTSKKSDGMDPRPERPPRYSAAESTPSTSFQAPTNYSSSARTASTSNPTSSSTSSLGHASTIVSFRDSLPEKPQIYSFPEISAATNNFLAKRISASAVWRCVLHGRDVVLVQRRLRRPLSMPELRQRLGVLSRTHHSTIAKLLGASLSTEYIYLVYEFVVGASLSDCLRNPQNPSFTVLGTWLLRMQIAADLAQGLEYIHHYTGLDIGGFHNHIKSSTVIVTDPDLHAKICLFGAAELAGELADNPELAAKGEITEESSVRRSGSRTMKVEGTRGYMAPEITTGGNASQKSDVFAFGVVMLELLSGHEPVRYRFERGDYERISVIDAAREAVRPPEEIGLRKWIDRRLRDSFPIDVAGKVTRVALECVHAEADKRPDMKRVAGKMSKLYLESKAWSERMTVPTAFSVSLAGR